MKIFVTSDFKSECLLGINKLKILEQNAFLTSMTIYKNWYWFGFFV